MDYKKLLKKIEIYLTRNETIEDKESLNQVAFVHLSEIILEKKYKESTIKSGVDTNGTNVLKKIYPYIFENRIAKEYPISENLYKEIYTSLNGELARDLIGRLYEDCFTNSKKKDIGQFYTRSSKVIDYMLDSISYTRENTVNKKIIDPATGSGLFLINAFNRLRDYMENNNFTQEDIIEQMTNNYYAVDIDPFACYLTEINLLIEIMDLAIESYIHNKDFKINKIKTYIGDFVKVPDALEQIALTSVKDINIFEENAELDALKSLRGEFKDGFDYVISNPPYVTMYGRRSRNMTEDKREYFNINYDFVINGKGNNKFNIIMFFIERSIKMINDGQKICLIVDMAIFETAFKDIRKYILETCIIESLTVDLKEFEDVASGQVVINLIKESSKDKRDNNTVKWIVGFNEEVFEIKQLTWYNSKNEYKFSKPLVGYESKIISSMEKHPVLHKFFPNKQLRTCCALTGRTEDFMTTEEEFTNDREDLIFPYLEGAKGLSYKLGPLTHKRYLRYDYDLQQKISEEFKEELTKLGVKNKKRIALGDRECYLAPKIFIRQSATELIASYTENKFASNNSMYILTNKIDTEENKQLLKYVTGLLNSDLLTYYAKKKRIIRMGKGKTPQIKTSDLQKLPLNISDDYKKEIVDLVEQLLNTRQNDEYFRKLERLNQIVYNLYSINDEEIEFIKSKLVCE